MSAKPKTPYLVRALNDWIVDSGYTPYIMVNASADGVQVPVEHVSEGKILLNISAHAVRDLLIGDTSISFSARFSGNPYAVLVPMESVIAIYARETGEGMMFENNTTTVTDGDDEPPKDGPDGPGNHLKLVK